MLLDPVLLWSVAALALALVLVGRQRGRGVLSLFVVLFLIQALGPVVEHLRGAEIYSGIVVGNIAVATRGFALAVGGLLLADLVVRQRLAVSSLVDVRRPDRWVLPVAALLVVLTVYAGLSMARMGPGILAADKGVRIAAAGGTHYAFLVVAMVAAATWPLVRPVRSLRPVYVTFLVAYAGYCIFTQERDFVFALLALAFLGRLSQPGSQLPRLVAAGLVAAVAVNALSTGRSSATEEEKSALFQGSLLFVDTRVLEYVPASTPNTDGSTYWAAFTSAVTRGRIGGDVSPTQWLVDSYAPMSTSGYGFSVTGEALLNFGMIGVLPVFLVIGVCVNLVVNRLDRSSLHAHLGYFLTMFVPYMFRSDSRGLISGVVLCLVLHGGLALVARPPRSDQELSPGWNSQVGRSARRS